MDSGILYILLLAFLPQQTVIRDRVDVIEINHFVDDEGDLVFDQIIFWRWEGYYAKYTVVAWRILRDVRESPKNVKAAPDGWKPRPKWKGGHASPLRRHDRGGWWISSWKDEKDKVWREVAAPMLRTTWTQYDPEVLDRGWLPHDQRVGLTQKRK